MYRSLQRRANPPIWEGHRSAVIWVQKNIFNAIWSRNIAEISNAVISLNPQIDRLITTYYESSGKCINSWSVANVGSIHADFRIDSTILIDQPINGDGIDFKPRTLIGFHLMEGAAENPPLGNPDPYSCQREYGDCDGRPSSPIGRAGLGLASLIVGSLCVGKGVYQTVERFALAWRNVLLVGIGGLAIVQGMLRLLMG